MSSLKFNRLTLIVDRKRGERLALFRCDCGNEKKIHKRLVVSGKIKSCGCLNKEALAKRNRETATHNLSKTRGYGTFASMKRRCNSKTDKDYKNYGGRGIKCLWSTYEDFLRDMGPRPPGRSIDRVDNDGHYCKENCRWATPKEQRANSRPMVGVHFFNYKGKKLTLTELSIATGINRDALRKRLVRRGWSLKRATETPIDPSKQRFRKL